MSLRLINRMEKLLIHFQRASMYFSPKVGASFLHLEPLINKTISPKDALYPVYKKDNAERNYFLSGLRQLAAFDHLLHKYTTDLRINNRKTHVQGNSEA